jgi:glycyl-tRNA synthetase beta chain
VANNQTPDNGNTIVAGNERVLRARLADARFFWEQDRKAALAARVEALADRVYHAKLGSVLDKVRRMERIAEVLVPHVPGADSKRSARAVLLAKADLSTGMVGEFPELQGVIGRYYALHDGEDPAVADAIADHYKPQGPNDTCPTAPDSIVVALADKLDSLAAFFAIGEKPTGSRDPFALRRAALGTIRLVLENRLRLPLRAAFTHAANALGSEYLDAGRELLAFVADRLKVHLREEGVRHDLIAALFALAEDDLVRLLARVHALAGFLDTEDGANLLVAYRRAANIVAIEQRKGGWTDGPVDRDLLRLSEERDLASRLDEAAAEATAANDREDFAQAMAALATLRRPVDEFFDKVTVNVDDPALRENRLRLLSRIRAVMNRVADFSQIEG